MLSYETTSQVGISAARIILREARAVERAWWKGGLGFDAEAVERPLVLSGKTPLFGRSGASDPDDLYMAFADALFILERLEQWSARFKVKWRLHMHDEDWGTIDPGGISRPLRTHLDKWAGRAKVEFSSKGRWVVDEKRRAEIAARHSGG